MKKILFFAVFIFCFVFGFGQNRIDTAGIGSSGKETIVTTKSIAADSEVFTFAEVMPEFLPKGEFYKFLAQNIRYPIAEKKKKIQGVVYVSFIIEKDGSVSNVQLVKEVLNGPGLSTEAIRVISIMPNWKPGEMNGHPVRVQLVQPVKFVLN
jgi:protein TonB